MLPRDERITTEEFRCAFEKGRVLRGALLHLRIYRRKNSPLLTSGEKRAQIEYSISQSSLENNQNSTSDNSQTKSANIMFADAKNGTRAAFVVTRKIGKATVRNRLRRRLREIYRLSSYRNDARLANNDLLIFTSANALVASNETLQKALEELLERAARIGVSSATSHKKLDEGSPPHVNRPEARRFAAVSVRKIGAAPEKSSAENAEVAQRIEEIASQKAENDA